MRIRYRASPFLPRCPRVSSWHAAAHPVQAQVGQPDDVERVGDLNGLGQRLVVGGPVGPGQVEGGPSYVVPPPGGVFSGFTWENIDQPAVADVHRRSNPHPLAAGALAEEQGFIQSQSLHLPHPIPVRFQQGLPPPVHLLGHRMPRATQLLRPPPTCRVAHRAARVVNRARVGYPGACSVNEPAPHPASGHSHRRLARLCPAGRGGADRICVWSAAGGRGQCCPARSRPAADAYGD